MEKRKMDKLIPVVVIKELSETDKILSALKKSGINCAEITFRTACAAEAIAIGVKEFPDMNVGAGTIINLAQAKKAIKAGAKFLVSPGLSVEVAKYAKKVGVAYYPGCVTPTEIMQALELGIEVEDCLEYMDEDAAEAFVFAALDAGRDIENYLDYLDEDVIKKLLLRAMKK